MQSTTSFKNISSEDLYKMMNESDVQVIDVRESYEFANGHIPVATLIPLQTIPSNMNQLDKDKKIVVVCASGARSNSAAGFLAQHGYEVYNMVGGMMGWRYEVAR
jgi:rhodanese-related sulfurtransferase